MSDTRFRGRPRVARGRAVVPEPKQAGSADLALPARKPWVKPTLTTVSLTGETRAALPGKSIADGLTSVS